MPESGTGCGQWLCTYCLESTRRSTFEAGFRISSERCHVDSIGIGGQATATGAGYPVSASAYTIRVQGVVLLDQAVILQLMQRLVYALVISELFVFPGPQLLVRDGDEEIGGDALSYLFG